MKLRPNPIRCVIYGLVTVVATMTGASPAFADRYRDAQWHLTALHVADAHRVTKGAGVTVAVIDTGVWADHPDLNGAVLPGRNVLENGGDGRSDVNGHGTGIASIIAARGRSGERGVLGVAPAAKILPLRPNSDTSLVADAINWSVRQGAMVINMSFVVTGSAELAAAIKSAADADVVLIAASGNDGQNSSTDDYPAAYPNVLAVAAVDRRGQAARFSHRGADVDIAAPGVGIPAADGSLTDGYVIADGTSPAAAVVSGAAALIRARYPDLSAAEVVQRLTSTAVDKGPPGRDDTYGHGSLDLMAALTADAPPPSKSPSVPATKPPGDARGEDDGSGVPLLAIGLGVLMLAGAAVAAVVVVRKREGS